MGTLPAGTIISVKRPLDAPFEIVADVPISSESLARALTGSGEVLDFSASPSVHRKLWPVGTVVHDGPQGAKGSLAKECIAQRMGRAIYEYRAKMSGAMRGEVVPKFIYLGRKEFSEFKTWARQEVSSLFALYREPMLFMGVEVITVDKPSHLAVGE